MLNELEISLYYQKLGLPPNVVRELEEMRVSAPVRAVSRGALKNFKVDFSSRRNGAMRQLESLSCEMVFALERELDPDVIGYWCQVGLKNVVRQRLVSAMTVDFMVYEPDRILLVECKPEDQIRKLAIAKPEEWVQTERGWSRPPVDDWARERGLHYRIWSPPEPFGTYLANLKLLYDRLGSAQVSPSSLRALQVLRGRLGCQPARLREALESVKGLTSEAVIHGLAAGTLGGTLRAVPLDDFDNFRLFASSEQAALADAELHSQLALSLEQPRVTSRFLNASRVDYVCGTRRLARVQRMIAEEEAISRRYKSLVKAVEAAIIAGTSPLDPCITRHADGGRRTPQLTKMQEEELDKVVQAFHAPGAARTQLQLFFDLKRRCEQRQIRTPSMTTLRQRLRRVGHGRRALNTGGRRAFHAAREAIDPNKRTIPALAFGLTAHVDSTKFDLRCIANLGPVQEQACPTLYVAMDQATGFPLGRAVVFGPSCRDALAILIRDILWRQGWLPRYWIADGGAEYTGSWFQSFCQATGASRLQPPPGAPRHNSMAENALGRVNKQLAHMLAGSTDPDKQGRRVDSRFKSYRTARLAFCEVVAQIDLHLFGDLSETPRGLQLGSPAEHRKDLVDQLGECGIQLPYDDAFRILTSIPLLRDARVDPLKGIRHEGRTYSSQPLFAKLATAMPTQKRRDCVDPSKMYVQFDGGWVTAFSQDAVKFQALTDLEKLFAKMSRSALDAKNREQRTSVSGLRHNRIDRANAADSATSHLPVKDERSEGASPAAATPWISPDVPLRPYFDEGGAA